MPVDFLSLLDETNSIKNEETGEIILISEKFQTEGDFELKTPCKISSKCNTVIISDHFEIASHSVSIDNIAFETSIHVVDSDNFQITNCTCKKGKLLDGALYFYNCKSVYISHVTITETDNIPGIYITSNCTVSADNLNIYGLSETLLVCNTCSNLYIKDSVLHHTKANAIYISGKSYIEIRNCSLYDTEYPAIFISQSTCRIEDNDIKNVQQNGISLNTAKSFVVCRNKITDVNGSAIAVLDDSSGIANRNIISKVGGNGIYVCQNSTVKAYKNIINDNRFPGIAILMKSNAKLYKNKISQIVYSGICVRGARDVKILNSDISNVQECGISISDTKKCVVKNNNISNCKISSVEVYNKSKAYIENNNIKNIGECAFLVFTSAYMKAENNTIKDVGNAMVKLIYKGGGDFINNRIENCPNQMNGKTSSLYLLSGNGNFNNITNDSTRLTDSIIFEEPYVENDSTLCLKCHKKPRDCYLLDCSHKVYCTECAELAKKNNELCPLCRFPIEKVTPGFTTSNDSMCVICFEKPADCIVVPCGHMGFCEHCLNHWYRTNKKCPVCRAEPSCYKKIISDI